jgi:hypothetical protein
MQLPQKDGVRFCEVTDQEEIDRYLRSNSSACWGNGTEIAEGWIHLATFSPQKRGEPQTKFVCKKSAISEKNREFIEYAAIPLVAPPSKKYFLD